jgi:hypothetical protein
MHSTWPSHSPSFLPSFFNNLPTLQHLVCLHICNFIYYIWAPKCGVDCSLSLRCSNNSVHTSNDTLCHITQQFTFLPHIILVTSAERYKLWRYSSCSFIHFPTTCRCKSLNTLNTTIPIFSLQFFLKVTHQVSYTRIYKKILGKHAHFCISEVTVSDSKAKYYVVCITQNSFPFHFFILQSLLLTTPPKYLISSIPFQNVQHWISWLQVMISFCKSSDQTLPYSFCALQTKHPTAI